MSRRRRNEARKTRSGKSHRIRFTTAASLVGIGAMVAYSACGTATASASTKKSYTFGIIEGFSGPAAIYGQYANEGYAVWKKVTGGKIDGHHVNVVRADNKELPQDTPAAYQKMIGATNRPIAFSMAGTPMIFSVIKQFTAQHIPDYNFGGAGQSLTGASPMLVNVNPMVAPEATALAKWAKDNGIKTVAGIYPNDGYGASTYPVFSKKFEQLGGKSVASVYGTLTQTTFRSQVAQVVANNPDAVYIGIYGTPVTTLIKQLRQAGFKGKILGNSLLDSTPTLKAGNTAVGSVMTGYPVTKKAAPGAAKFYRVFEKKYHFVPSFYAAGYYTVFNMWSQAIRHLLKEHKAVNGKNLVAADKAIGTFNSPFGVLHLQKNGSVTTQVSVVTVKNKKFVTITSHAGKV